MPSPSKSPVTACWLSAPAWLIVTSTLLLRPITVSTPVRPAPVLAGMVTLMVPSKLPVSLVMLIHGSDTDVLQPPQNGGSTRTPICRSPPEAGTVYDVNWIATKQTGNGGCAADGRACVAHASSTAAAENP